MRDVSFVVVATVLAGVLSVWFAPIGSVVASASPASSVAVELLIPLVVLLVGGIILAFSRVRQLRHEVRRRLQAEDELQRFFALAPDLLCIAGTDGYFKRVNASFTRILGYREDELLGAPFGDFVHEDDRAATNVEVEKLAQGIPTVHFVNRYRCADGTYRWFDWNSEPGPAHRLIFAAARDITERRKAEEDLLQAERLAAIGEAMAGLSHESRNALQRSQGFLERLAFKIQDNPAAMESIPEATVFVGEIQAAQDELARLYERVLDYAAPIKLQYECCSLRELLDEAWEKLAANRQGRDARLFHDSPERDDTCWVDKHRLGQVLLNVLENSLAASADPVEVRTAWEPAEIESRPALRISLHDSGPGFKEEERRRVFDPFFTTKTRGTGLGLAIVKRLVEAHGGEIAVADDEAAMQDYFEDMLTRMGHRVVSICKTGEELVEKCCADRPDLVITDIFMPDLDGIDAAARICEELPVPVILVTGQHESEVVARIEAEHIMAYLFKPIRKEHLETAIAIARQRFGQFQALVKETADLKQALHDRKIIEKAKGIIMKEAALDEDAAFRRMQRLARAKSQKLVDFATVILMAKEAFSPRDEGE